MPMVRLPLTLNACARALEVHAVDRRHAAEQGYEVCCHGWRWESHAGMEQAVSGR